MSFPVIVEGRTAEWIVERQTQVGTPDLRPFCDYGEVVFHGCTAEVTSRVGSGAPKLQEFSNAVTAAQSKWSTP